MTCEKSGRAVLQVSSDCFSIFALVNVIVNHRLLYAALRATIHTSSDTTPLLNTRLTKHNNNINNASKVILLSSLFSVGIVVNSYLSLSIRDKIFN